MLNNQFQNTKVPSIQVKIITSEDMNDFVDNYSNLQNNIQYNQSTVNSMNFFYQIYVWI